LLQGAVGPLYSMLLYFDHHRKSTATSEFADPGN
jgi:hypothetical protein